MATKNSKHSDAPESELYKFYVDEPNSETNEDQTGPPGLLGYLTVAALMTGSVFLIVVTYFFSRFLVRHTKKVDRIDTGF